MAVAGTSAPVLQALQPAVAQALALALAGDSVHHSVHQRSATAGFSAAAIDTPSRARPHDGQYGHHQPTHSSRAHQPLLNAVQALVPDAQEQGASA